jgi:hypothetical protein
MHESFAKSQSHKSSKRSRLIRPNAACITDTEFRSQLIEKEELSKKKQQEAIIRKEKAEQNKIARAEAKQKAAEKRSLSKARKQVQARAKVMQAEKKSIKKLNKANKMCYVCESDSHDCEAKSVRRWRFCEQCGLWCCVDCLPSSYLNEDVVPKSFFCNTCVAE